MKNRIFIGILLVAGIFTLPFILFIPFLIPVLLLGGVIYLGLKYPEIKGSVGEKRVNRLLSQLGREYKVYHDIYVTNEKGGTAQIDHVVVSPYGIFVIETKNFEGWIFGDEHQKYWTQVIYKRKEKFYNPIWQNYGHILSLKQHLNMKDSLHFHSIIAFSNNAELKFKREFKAKVIYFSQLVDLIKQSQSQSFPSKDIQKVNLALDLLQIEDKRKKKRIKQQHVKSLTEFQKEKAKVARHYIKENRCPKCGGALTMKKGKFGSFTGCSNFPNCRYTQKGA